MRRDELGLLINGSAFLDPIFFFWRCNKLSKVLMLGNEAIAWGAIAAGVNVVSAYPGTPSTEVFTTLAEHASEYGYYAEWCVNEKVALELAYGAAISGARSLVSMKQVGLNVAADPLLSGTYLGVKGGLVLVVADDPGPHSSQTEQDTRHFAAFAKVPVLDPSDPQEAMAMTMQAFDISEKYHLPVIIRPTTRVCHAGQDVDMPLVSPVSIQAHFEKDDWVIFPPVSYRKHGELLKTLDELGQCFCDSEFNYIVGENPDRDYNEGIICSGVSYQYVAEAIKRLDLDLPLMKIGTPYPFPDNIVLDFVKNKQHILVVEEQDAVVEDHLLRLLGINGLAVCVSGKLDHCVSGVGELNVNAVEEAICRWQGREPVTSVTASKPELPVRTPILCAGCPHRASFYAIRKAAGKKSDIVFTGDIGCYTLGMMPPLSAVDTCLCMGAAITQAQGIGRAEPGRKSIAVLGDSTFYHSGLPGVVNAVYNQYPLTLVVLDNSTTAMTGFQPHPGTGITAMGEAVEALNIESVLEGFGVRWYKTVDPGDLDLAVQTVREALAYDGVSVVIMKSPCVNLPSVNKERKPIRIIAEQCKECGLCVTEIGCPALVGEKGKLPLVMDTCVGCGLCKAVCPFDAIEGGNA